MTTTERQDKYNSQKVWIIKRSKCGHYYINQKINGKMFYSKFQRKTLKFIKSIFED